MLPSEETTSERAQGGHPEVCALAQAELPAYLAGDLLRPQQRRLRAHLVGCSSCRTRFEAALGFAARLHSKGRRAGEAAERIERRKVQRARALAGALRISGGEQGARLRLLVLPALAILLLTQLSRGPRAAEGARVVVVEGLAQIGSRELLAPEAAVLLRAGELCATAEAGRAHLALAGGTAELGPDTRVWLESGPRSRLRVGEGHVLARGRLILTSRLGVVEVTGVALVRLTAQALGVDSLEGEVLVADSRGSRVVPAGGTLALPAP